MHTFLNYNVDDCPYYYFDSSYKTLLGACLFVFGIFGVLLNSWLFITFIHSHLVTYRSHILVLNLCTASLGRNLLGFPFAGSSAIAKSWLYTSACCQLFAFLNQFFGVYQMTAILVLIFERYLLVRFYRQQKCLHLRVYCAFIMFCWTSATAFAVPPLFGYGVYSCDATGTCCTLLWPHFAVTRQFGFCLPYVLITGVIPVIAIFFFMGKTIRLEKIYYRSQEQREQTKLTTSCQALAVATFLLWIPAAVLIGWQWFPLLMYGYRIHVPAALALIAPIASEAATSVPVLCYLVADERLRAGLLGRMRKHYALLHPKRAKKYKYDSTSTKLLTD